MGEKTLPPIERTMEVLLGDSGYIHFTAEPGNYHLKVITQNDQWHEVLGADEEGTVHHVVYDPNRVDVLVENLAIFDPAIEAADLTPDGAMALRRMAEREGYLEVIQTQQAIMALRPHGASQRYTR